MHYGCHIITRMEDGVVGSGADWPNTPPIQQASEVRLAQNFCYESVPQPMASERAVPGRKERQDERDDGAQFRQDAEVRNRGGSVPRGGQFRDVAEQRTQHQQDRRRSNDLNTPLQRLDALFMWLELTNQFMVDEHVWKQRPTASGTILIIFADEQIVVKRPFDVYVHDIRRGCGLCLGHWHCPRWPS
jgi:hypothetical protein